MFFLWLTPSCYHAFTTDHRHVYARAQRRIYGNNLPCLEALTERQMQFWEDVEEGLDDIEDFYAKKGQSIDRLRVFGKR